MVQFDTDQMIEVTPIVNDGVMYVTEPPSIVHALNASTGANLWTYTHRIPTDVAACCGLVNRGVAALDDQIFLATIDAKLIALDAATGKARWQTEIADYKSGVTVTGAPLAIRDKVIVGVSGGDMGIRGFLDAYDAKTGKRLWRYYTIPAEGEPGNETWGANSWKKGGAPTWLTGSFDPELNLVYWGVGNPGPDYQADVRPGDNLYSDCVVALNADTGKLVWYFQFTPNDEHDWDANQIPILIDAKWKGVARKLLITANRNGFFYVLDRQSGEFLLGTPFGKQNWALGLNKQGRPILNPKTRVSTAGTVTWPDPIGATNWQSPTFSPITRTLYVPFMERGQIVFKQPDRTQYVRGEEYLGSGHQNITRNQPLHTGIKAINPMTGDVLWRCETRRARLGGNGAVLFQPPEIFCSVATVRGCSFSMRTKAQNCGASTSVAA